MMLCCTVYMCFKTVYKVIPKDIVIVYFHKQIEVRSCISTLKTICLICNFDWLNAVFDFREQDICKMFVAMLNNILCNWKLYKVSTHKSTVWKNSKYVSLVYLLKPIDRVVVALIHSTFPFFYSIYEYV